jgi:hydrogenase nickel incorporation protein HypA/HybF
MLRQVEEIAKVHNAQSVARIRIQVGPLSGVDPELLARAYTIAQAGTLAAAAELMVETLPVRVHCNVCGADTEAAPNALVCAACGDWRTRLQSGDELVLASIEIIA